VFTARFKSSVNLDRAGTTPSLERRVETVGEQALAAATPPLRILVAEDNELNVAVIAGLLRRRGHRVRVVHDGRAALSQAIEGGFDLLMLDLHMPEMDGFDVARALREHERSRGTRLPIIALTARSSSRDRELCRAAGMDEFVTKPIEAQLLWKAIERISVAFPSELVGPSLLDAPAILRACGGQSSAFERLRDVFRRTLPQHMDRTRAALEARDLPSVREAAHILYGTVAAFSPIAGEVAASLEEAAIRGEAASCSEIGGRLESMCTQLLGETGVLAMEDLSPDPPLHRLDEERDAPVAAGERVLDADALWAACEGDERVLRILCIGLQAHLPTRLQELEQALSAVDSARLHDVAYKLCAMLPAFSTTGGEVASELEGLAAAGHVDEARPLVAKLGAVARQLLLQTENLSVESLNHP
jgi:CheY-like chemotaxis protein